VHPSLFFHPGALLSLSELNSARLDGLLIEVGDGYMPPDLPEDAIARMFSLAPVLIPGYAACATTAAWVHGAGDPAPLRHHLQRVSARRRRVQVPSGVMLHESRLDDDDFTLVAGAAVTTPLRTMIDLALRADTDEAAAIWLPRLASSEPEIVPDAIARLESRPRLPGKRAAMTALKAIEWL